MKFFMHLPDISSGEHERIFRMLCKFYDRVKLPPHERIFRMWFTHEGEELLAEVGKSVLPGHPPVVAIFGGDPVLVCRITDGPFKVPAHRVSDAEYFDGVHLVGA